MPAAAAAAADAPASSAAAAADVVVTIVATWRRVHATCMTARYNWKQFSRQVIRVVSVNQT